MKTIEIKIDELINRVASLEDNMKLKDEQIEELLQDIIKKDQKIEEKIHDLEVIADYCKLFYYDLKDIISDVSGAKAEAVDRLLRASRNGLDIDD